MQGYHEKNNFMKTKKIVPIHPGEILLEEYLKPMGNKSVPAGPGH